MVKRSSSLDNGNPDRARIAIIDDHPVIRQGVRALIEREPDLTVCGEAEGRRDALLILGDTSPDVAIVDLYLKEENGLDLIRDIALRFPEIKVLVLSMLDESVYAERAFRAGATGYVMKHEAPRTLIEAIRNVHRGEIHVSPAISQRLLDKAVRKGSGGKRSSVDDLTDRELEVFKLIGHGFKPSAIAEKLHLSVKTVETYRSRIKEKLGIKTAGELAQHAVQWVWN